MGGSDSAEMLQGELGAPNGNGDPISPYTGAGPRGEDCECQAQWRGPEPAVGTKPSPSLGQLLGPGRALGTGRRNIRGRGRGGERYTQRIEEHTQLIESLNCSGWMLPMQFPASTGQRGATRQ